MTSNAEDQGYEVEDGARIVCTGVRSNTPDPGLVDFVTTYGGLNRFGEPMFRIVWGGTRFAWKTRLYQKKDEHGNVVSSSQECRWDLKYPKLRERWVLEHWKAPTEFFGGDRDAFYEGNIFKDEVTGVWVYTKAPFPSRGEYEYLDTFLGEDGESYAAPELRVAKFAIDCYRHLKHGMNETDFYNDKVRQIELKDRNELLDIYDEIKDGTRPSAHRPWVSLSY